MFGYVIVGSLAGLIAVAVGLVLGAPLWLALLAYPTVGSSILLVVPLVRAGWDLGLVQGRTGTAPVSNKAMITLPSGPASVEQASALKTMRILAVDDDPFIQEIVQKIAATSGISDVITAGSGEEALQILAGTDRVFDCLLFDIDMPGLDGSDLCSLVRHMPAYRQTPIIMLTAKRDTKNMERAFRAGATDYATKPFDIVAFGDRLQKLTRAGEMRGGCGGVPSTPPSEDYAVSLRQDTAQHEIKRMAAGTEPSGLVSFAALRNYIDELPNTALLDIRVLAVRIDSAEHFGSLSRSQVTKVHQAVADATTASFGAALSLLAYMDERTLLVASGDVMEPSVDLQHRLNLSVRQMLGGDGEAWDISLHLGKSVQLHGVKRSRVGAVFDRAVPLVIDQSQTGEGEMVHRRQPLAS